VTENEGSAWKDLVSISSDQVVNFGFETYPKDRPATYPGYDMMVKVNIGSLRFVFINRIIKELATYFGAFAKMRELMSAAATYYYKASIQAVQQQTTSQSTMRFRCSSEICSLASCCFRVETGRYGSQPSHCCAPK